MNTGSRATSSRCPGAGGEVASSRVAVGTIVAKNYLAFARVLARSLAEHHPAIKLHVLLADRVDGAVSPDDEPFDLECLETLGIPDVERFCFAYNRQQLTVAAKPYLLGHLLDRGYGTAVFLDADVMVLGDLNPLFAEAAAHAVTLTPHLLGPLQTDRAARELNILRSGVFNGGFIGVSSGAPARRFLAWWADRMSTHCRFAPDQGMHYDQRWLDLAPSLFDDVHVVRDPGCNVAYWNLPERALRVDSGRFVVEGGSPCRFFHFSGFEPESPTVVTRYSTRIAMQSIGAAAALFARFTDRLAAEGQQHAARLPYAFGSFDNGVQIPELARRIYLEMESGAAAYGNPFTTGGEDSYFSWLTRTGDSPLNRLWDHVYRDRPDLQIRFPDPCAADYDRFRAWILESGLSEHRIAPAFAL
jgi:hypothetical protein